jgi:hypothetical protein
LCFPKPCKSIQTVPELFQQVKARVPFRPDRCKSLRVTRAAHGLRGDLLLRHIEVSIVGTLSLSGERRLRATRFEISLCRSYSPHTPSKILSASTPSRIQAESAPLGILTEAVLCGILAASSGYPSFVACSRWGGLVPDIIARPGLCPLPVNHRTGAGRGPFVRP